MHLLAVLIMELPGGRGEIERLREIRNNARESGTQLSYQFPKRWSSKYGQKNIIKLAFINHTGRSISFPPPISIRSWIPIWMFFFSGQGFWPPSMIIKLLLHSLVRYIFASVQKHMHSHLDLHTVLVVSSLFQNNSKQQTYSDNIKSDTRKKEKNWHNLIL